MNWPYIAYRRASQDTKVRPLRRTQEEWAELDRAYEEWAKVNLMPKPRLKFSRREGEGGPQKN